MNTATLLTALAVGLLALGASARPSEKTSLRLKEALSILTEKKVQIAKSDDSGSDESGYSGEWDWDFGDWVEYLQEVCGLQDDWPATHGGPLTPGMLGGELADFSEYISNVTDAIVTHRDTANEVADQYAEVDATDDATFMALIGAHTALFHQFSQSMDGLGHGAMCTMIRLEHLKNRFNFEGAEGFARSDDECSAARNLVADSDDLEVSVSDRDFMVSFGAAMRSDIACAADEIQGFKDHVEAGLAAADLSMMNRRQVSGIFLVVENFMETAGREIYEFSDAVHRVGAVLRELYGQADERVVAMKAAEVKAENMSTLMKLFYKALKKNL